MNVNEKIRMLRELNHWSQEEMAERLGMSHNGYAKIKPLIITAVAITMK